MTDDRLDAHGPAWRVSGRRGPVETSVGEVLFKKRFWRGITDGSITVAFRRWRRPQVVAGRTYRTPAGRLEVVAVDVVNSASIGDEDARSAGYSDAASLVADLRADDRLTTYRIEFHRHSDADPRAELADDATLGEEDLAEIDRRLDRLDRASKDGAWTRPTLRLIRDHPGRRARELAAMVGRERDDFKTDVRKLTKLGLTTSLPVGYQLSARGRAYAQFRIAAPDDAGEA